MSSRLIALLLFTLASPAMTQAQTTTEAAEQANEAVEAASEETSQAAETAMEETQAATEEAAMATEAAAEEAQTVTEEATEATAESTEQTATEMTEEATDEGSTTAEQSDESTETQASEESTEAADTAAVSDVQTKIVACAACHGADGNSVIPENPKLAGQVPGYIADQLAKFKSGERENAIMAAQVANLTEEDMKEIDAFYVAQQPQLGAISEDMQEMALIGEKIFRGGEPSMSISACMSCHGPSGHGIPTRFPKVSGQHIEYLEASLLAYKSGSRVSDVMNPIAFRLSEQQIKALSLYMHGLK